MALREYKCPKCGAKTTEITGWEFPKTRKCECGSRMKYVFGAPSFSIAFRDGYDIGADAYFNSERERSNFLSKNGLRRIKS